MLPRLLVCAALLLAVAPPAPVPAQELLRIRVGATLNDDCTSLVYAQRSGLFRRAGLDVELEGQNSGAAIASAIVAGSYDLGKSSLVSLFNARLRGLPFVLLAPAGISDARAPYAQLVVAAGSPIRSGKDLNGKVVGVQSLNDLNQVVTAAWVDKHGGDSRTLKYVEIPMSAAAPAIAQHRIDAAVLVHPPLDKALSEGTVRVLGDAYGAIAPRILVSGWFTTSDWVKKHPDAARKFAQTLAEAAAYTNGHHAETAEMMATLMKIPMPVMEHMTRAVDGTSLSRAEIQPLMDAAVEYKMIPRPVPVDDLLTDLR